MVNSTWFMYALISFATALDVAPQTPHRRMVSNEYSSQGGITLLGTATCCSWWSIDIGCSFTSPARQGGDENSRWVWPSQFAILETDYRRRWFRTSERRIRKSSNIYLAPNR